MDICIWNKCNNQCLMCSNPVDFHSDNHYDFKSLKSKLTSQWFRRDIKKNDSILLTGGEPTIHPEFFRIIKFIRAEYPEHWIHLLTNGRCFFYDSFAREIMQTKKIKIAISLYGHNGVAHDKVTCAEGSFKQSLKGLENILHYKDTSLKQEIHARIVVSGLNYQYINEMLKLADNFSSLNGIVLIFAELEGRALENFAQTAISYKKITPYLSRAYPILKSCINRFRLYHFPLCALEPKLWPFAWRTLPAEEIAFLSSCKRCRYKKYCLGIPKNYLEAMGDKEFTPIRKQIRITEGESLVHHPIIQTDSVS